MERKSSRSCNVHQRPCKEPELFPSMQPCNVHLRPCKEPELFPSMQPCNVHLRPCKERELFPSMHPCNVHLRPCKERELFTSISFIRAGRVKDLWLFTRLTAGFYRGSRLNNRYSGKVDLYRMLGMPEKISNFD